MRIWLFVINLLLRSINYRIFFIWYFLSFLSLEYYWSYLVFHFKKIYDTCKWNFTIMIYQQEFVNKYLTGWNFCHGIVFCKKNSFSCEKSIYKAKFFFILTHVSLSLLEECFGEHFGECIGECNGGIPTWSL